MDGQEHDTAEWEKSQWTNSQIPPNGYYNAMQPARGGLVRRSGGVASGPSDREHEHEYPATPVQGLPHDHFAVQQVDGVGGSGSKKSRTKPIRNAEGILIRKDGRPDMRSVSSANNLRKVHAKKEAERAEMEGRTPTSARSLAPAHSNSLSDEMDASRDGTPMSATAGEGGEHEHEHDTQERHHELMSKIFPHGIDGVGGRMLAEKFFPRQGGGGETAATLQRAIKLEFADQEPDELARGHEAGREPADTQMTDVVMRGSSEARAEGHATAFEQHEHARPMDLVPEAQQEARPHVDEVRSEQLGAPVGSEEQCAAE